MMNLVSVISTFTSHLALVLGPRIPVAFEATRGWPTILRVKAMDIAGLIVRDPERSRVRILETVVVTTEMVTSARWVDNVTRFRAWNVARESKITVVIGRRRFLLTDGMMRRTTTFSASPVGTNGQIWVVKIGQGIVLVPLLSAGFVSGPDATRPVTRPLWLTRFVTITRAVVPRARLPIVTPEDAVRAMTRMVASEVAMTGLIAAAGAAPVRAIEI
ncbi:hypothetical protein TWF703_002069 [Orbilia oligospora]|uniref:Secreted protein n=1 Tax=Orbilia oligospora TaxID=2813651 RepID=A0A7C8JYY7_ORBOL|nr:hypothetical protein TWF703_002069 [Orbilia oligospora]